MADKHIGALPAAADLYDDSLLVAEQQGDAVKITGRQWKSYAQSAVRQYVEDAQKAAENALSAVSQIGTAVTDARVSADAAEVSAERAEKAKQDLLNAEFNVDAADGHLYMSIEEEK